MADEQMVYGNPVFIRSQDWKGWASVAGVALALLVAIGGAWRSMATIEDIEKRQAPIERRLDAFEVFRDGTRTDMSKLSSAVDILKVQLATVETGQARMESMLRESSSELKAMVRDISNKLERYQAGARSPVPQDWWEDEWHLRMPLAAEAEATRAGKRRGE